MLEHVHFADGPGAEVLLLAKQAHVLSAPSVRGDVLRGLDQHATGAAGRIADAHALLWLEQFDHELYDHVGRVELAALLAGVIGKLLNQILISSSEEIWLTQVAVTQVDRR